MVKSLYFYVLMVSSRFAQATWPTEGASITLLDTLVQGMCNRNFQMYLQWKIKGILLP